MFCTARETGWPAPLHPSCTSHCGPALPGTSCSSFDSPAAVRPATKRVPPCSAPRACSSGSGSAGRAWTASRPLSETSRCTRSTASGPSSRMACRPSLATPWMAPSPDAGCHADCVHALCLASSTHAPSALMATRRSSTTATASSAALEASGGNAIGLTEVRLSAAHGATTRQSNSNNHVRDDARERDRRRPDNNRLMRTFS